MLEPVHKQSIHTKGLDERPNSIARVMIECEVMAQWVTCQRGRVGSALVDKNGVILVPARNGTPYGYPSCKEQNRNVANKCEVCVHSERNVINHAARHGTATNGHDIVTLRRPCVSCASDIVQAGISAVYYRWPYDTDNHLGGLNYVEHMFDKAGILLFRVPMSEQEYTFHEMITEWRRTWTKTL